jgi:hypothetical protein
MRRSFALLCFALLWSSEWIMDVDVWFVAGREDLSNCNE